MSDPSGTQSSAVIIGEAEAGRLHDIETASRLARVRPELIEHYVRLGLIAAVEDRWFDDDTIFVLRQIETLRSEHVNFRGIRVILELLREAEQLKSEVRFLRGW